MNLKEPAKQPDPARASLRSQSGASLVEYSLLIALLVLMAIPAVGFVGERVHQSFHTAGEQLTAGGGITPPCNTPPNFIPCD